MSCITVDAEYIEGLERKIKDQSNEIKSLKIDMENECNARDHEIISLEERLETEKIYTKAWEENANKALRAIRTLGERLKSYEDAEEQGLLIKLPCKVGDTVYIINSCKQICERECCGFLCHNDTKLKIWYRWVSEETRLSNAGTLNINVFLSGKAAEEALNDSK